MDKTTKTAVMTAEQTLAWLEAYFFGKTDFCEIYRGSSTWIYEWALDENVEVIEVLEYDSETDGYYYEYTINFYSSATDGIPYRTGTTWVDDI